MGKTWGKLSSQMGDAKIIPNWVMASKDRIFSMNFPWFVWRFWMKILFDCGGFMLKKLSTQIDHRIRIPISIIYIIYYIIYIIYVLYYITKKPYQATSITIDHPQKTPCDSLSSQPQAWHRNRPDSFRMTSATLPKKPNSLPLKMDGCKTTLFLMEGQFSGVMLVLGWVVRQWFQTGLCGWFLYLVVWLIAIGCLSQ